ncbi:hypothetical protein AgCh_005254 [Apium graveolens]
MDQKGGHTQPQVPNMAQLPFSINQYDSNQLGGTPGRGSVVMSVGSVGTEIFDFLVDIVPREDIKDEALESVLRGQVPDGGPSDSFPYYYMQQQQSPQMGSSGMIMSKPVMDPALFSQPPHPLMAPQMWPQEPHQAPQPAYQQPQSPSDSSV